MPSPARSSAISRAESRAASTASGSGNIASCPPTDRPPFRRLQPRDAAAFLVDQYRCIGAAHGGAQFVDQRAKLVAASGSCDQTAQSRADRRRKKAGFLRAQPLAGTAQDNGARPFFGRFAGVIAQGCTQGCAVSARRIAARPLPRRQEVRPGRDNRSPCRRDRRGRRHREGAEKVGIFLLDPLPILPRRIRVRTEPSCNRVPPALPPPPVSRRRRRSWRVSRRRGCCLRCSGARVEPAAGLRRALLAAACGCRLAARGAARRRRGARIGFSGRGSRCSTTGRVRMVEQLVLIGDLHAAGPFGPYLGRTFVGADQRHPSPAASRRRVGPLDIGKPKPAAEQRHDDDSQLRLPATGEGAARLASRASAKSSKLRAGVDRSEMTGPRLTSPPPVRPRRPPAPRR